MKVTQRVPLDQFAYIEFEQDYPNVEDAIAHNKQLIAEHNSPGLPANEWAKVRNQMFKTGQFDPNIVGLSNAQRFFINQCKLALRGVDQDLEPTIN